MNYIAISSQKNYLWIWIAVDRFRKKYLSFVCGDRSTQTGRKLWKSIKGINNQQCCTDYWKSYGEFIPPERHIKSKVESYTVEGYNELGIISQV